MRTWTIGPLAAALMALAAGVAHAAPAPAAVSGVASSPHPGVVPGKQSLRDRARRPLSKPRARATGRGEAGATRPLRSATAKRPDAAPKRARPARVRVPPTQPELADASLLAPPAPGGASPEAPATTAAVPASVPPSPPAPPRTAPRARSGGFLSRGVDATAAFSVSAGVPEGFEELLRPQRTMVDIYFGGRPIGTMMADYTADSLEFVHPEEIVERIPQVLNPTELASHLKGKLATNAELVCQPGLVTGCGRLEPEVIGIIFDESRFRADVFVNPQQLAVQEQRQSRYLPPPAYPDALSLVQNLSAVVSQSDTAEAQHTLTGNTWLGRGIDHVHSQWYNTAEQGLAIDQLAWRRDLPDHSVVAGLFESRNDDLYFAQSALLAGGGMGRSLKLRTDIASESATRLQVFLGSRSMVEIYRDGRLVSSQFYDPGNQMLDTSNLPFGSYDVEIRIVDAAGVVTRQTRFFIKSTQLAPPGEPQWFLEGGEVMARSLDATVPEDAGTVQVRGGWRSRLRDDVGYAVGGAGVATHALAEGSLTWLQPMFTLGGSLMTSSQGDNGWALLATGRWRDLSGAVALRSTHAVETPASTDDYQLVSGSSDSRSVTLNYPVLGGQLGAQYFDSSSIGSDTTIYGLRYTRNLQLGLFPPVFLNVQLTRTDDDTVAMVGLDLTGFGDHWSWRLNPSLRHRAPASGGGSDAPVLSASGGWRDGDRWAEDVETSLRTVIDDTSTTLGLDARVASDVGRLQATMDQVQADSGDSRRFNARYDTSLVAGGHHFGFGGRQTASGSVLVDLRSAPDSAEFDILVDGRRLYSVRGGRQVPLMLPAYHRYTLQLADRGLSLLHFDNVPREVMIYPGTVVTLSYPVQQVVVAFGRLVRPPSACAAPPCAPEPLANARLVDLPGLALTEEDGSFQVEMLNGTRRLRARKSGEECTAVMPEPRMSNGNLLLGTLECLPDEARAGSPAATAVPAEPPATKVPGGEAPAQHPEAGTIRDAAPQPEPAARAPEGGALVPAAAGAEVLPAAIDLPATTAIAPPARATVRPPARRGARLPRAGRAAPAATKSAPVPGAEPAAAAAAPSPERLAEERKRRERLRKMAAKVQKARAEYRYEKMSQPGVKPAPRPEPVPVDRRERLRRNKQKVEQLLKH